MDSADTDPTAVSTNSFTSNAQCLILPGTDRPLRLGAGFRSDFAKQGSNPWMEENAFDQGTHMIFSGYSGSGSYVESSSSGSSTHSEHLSVGFGVGIGNDYVGASVTGRYDKNAMSNHDVGVRSFNPQIGD